MTTDERRALLFLALLLFVSAALRLAGVPEPVAVPGGGAAGGLELASHIEATRAAVAERERLERPLAEGERIDPNTASAAELQRLPRVGPGLAARIVADRSANGRFPTLESLARVPGIGEATVARLAPHLDLRPGRGAGGGGGARPRGGRTPAEARPPGSPGSPEGALDLNTADAAALAGLSGIGPVLAARIVAHRDSAGGFGAVEELLAVKGIGPSTLARIRERVRVYP